MKLPDLVDSSETRDWHKEVWERGLGTAKEKEEAGYEQSNLEKPCRRSTSPQRLVESTDTQHSHKAVKKNSEMSLVVAYARKEHW